MQENPIWQQKPFSKGQAWVDLLLMANFEDKEIFFDGGLITVQRGSFITSEIKLMDRWGWSKSKLRYFLFSLESQQMLVKISDQKKTTLTITNYCVWQDSQTDKELLKDRQQTTDRLLKDTDKNVKKERSKEVKILYSSEYVRMAEKLKELILLNNPGAKTPDDLSKWAIDFERMTRIDKRTPEQIITIIEFSQKDDFWKSNILSAGKLRKQFDTLWLQKDRPKQQQGKPTNNGNFQQRPIPADEEIEKLYKDV